MSRQIKRQQGSALITSLLVIGLCSTIIAGMVWQQNLQVRQIEIQRDKVQVNWLQRGAVDWARLILTEDLKSNSHDHLGEVWALPLSDSQLDDFLKKVELGVELKGTSLKGQLFDAQAKFNLANLWDSRFQSAQPSGILAFERLLEINGLDKKYAQQLSQKVLEGDLPPAKLKDIPAIISMNDQEWRILKDDLILLPEATLINANTASAKVLFASMSGLSQSNAEAIVSERAKKPFVTISEFRTYLGNMGISTATQNSVNQVGVSSRFFIAQAEIKHGSRVFVRSSLIERGNKTSSVNNTRIIWEIDPRDM
jgi:general secretion pathway protein K